MADKVTSVGGLFTYLAGAVGTFLSQLGPDDILLYLSIIAVIVRIYIDVQGYKNRKK